MFTCSSLGLHVYSVFTVLYGTGAKVGEIIYIVKMYCKNVGLKWKSGETKKSRG